MTIRESESPRESWETLKMALHTPKLMEQSPGLQRGHLAGPRGHPVSVPGWRSLCRPQRTDRIWVAAEEARLHPLAKEFPGILIKIIKLKKKISKTSVPCLGSTHTHLQISEF